MAAKAPKRLVKLKNAIVARMGQPGLSVSALRERYQELAGYSRALGRPHVACALRDWPG